MKTRVRVVEQILVAILREGSSDAARECCGLLAGRDGVITHLVPTANVAPNPATTYEIAPREIFHHMREMRAAGLDLVGIYHSHPNGHNEPSPRDIESAYYPDAAYFIISPLPGALRPLRAFSIRDGRVTELEIEVEPVKEAPDGSP